MFSRSHHRPITRILQELRNDDDDDDDEVDDEEKRTGKRKSAPKKVSYMRLYHVETLRGSEPYEVSFYDDVITHFPAVLGERLQDRAVHG